MRKTLRKCLARLLALTVVASMTCSYVFAADFGDLQDAVSGSTVDGKAPSEAVDVSDISRPAEPTDEKTEPADNTGANDATGGTETNRSSPEDGEPAGDTGSTGSDADNAGSSNKSGDGTGSTGDAGNTNSEGNEPAGGDGEEDNISGEDGNTNGEGGNTDNAGDNKSANSEDNQQGDKPVGEPKVEEPNKAPETKETKPDPKNGDIVETGEDGTVYYGYGWTKKEDGTWVYGITAYDQKSGQGDDGKDIYDRHVQLNESVSYDSGSDSSKTITIGKTPSGGSIYLDLGGFNITGDKSSSVITVGKEGQTQGSTGSLILDDSSDDKTGKITGGSTGIATWGPNSTVVMNGGNITGNNTSGVGGGVINRSDFTMNGGTISNNTAGDKGGGVFNNQVGKFTMNGGEISGNTAGNYGGGVYVSSSSEDKQYGSFTMNGGIISGNKTSLDPGATYNEKGETKGQGGGVYVAEGGSFTMNDTKDKDDNIIAIPVIEKNESGEGGGVFIAKGAVFTMNNGEVDNNIARIGEGGGIYIRGVGTINAGSITNNKTYTVNDLGGGGIYIENSGKLHLYNAIITDNKAGGLGAGLAACVHGKTVVFVKDGAAIYGNASTVTEDGKSEDENGKALETAVSKGHGTGDDESKWNGTKIDGHDLWEKNADFKGGAQDIFTASNSNVNDSSIKEYGKPGIIIGSQMLGGHDANWTGFMFFYKENGELSGCEPVVRDEDGNFVYANRLLGVKADVTPDSDTIKAAEAAAKAAVGGGVWITGNYSATHGGGVANNGLLIIGKDVIKEDPPEDIKGDKTLTKDENAPATTPDREMQDGEFTFLLTDDQTGEVIFTGTNKGGTNPDRDDVVISFPYGYFSHKDPGTYTFTVTEQKKENDPNTLYDDTKYQIVVTITQKGVKLPGVDIGNDKDEFDPDKVYEYETKVVINKWVVNEDGTAEWKPLAGDEKMSFNNHYTSTSTPEIPTNPGGGGDDDDDDDDEPRTPPTTPEDPTVEVPEEDVPLANLPEEPTEEVEIPEEDVPLAESPQTGDGSRTALWAAMSGFSLLGMLGLMLGKKRDEL